MSSSRIKTYLFVLSFFVSCFSLSALEIPDKALIFSLSGLDLEGYEGGAGFKIGSGPYDLRLGVNLLMNESSDGSGLISSAWGVSGSSSGFFLWLPGPPRNL